MEMVILVCSCMLSGERGFKALEVFWAVSSFLGVVRCLLGVDAFRVTATMPRRPSGAC